MHIGNVCTETKPTCDGVVSLENFPGSNWMLIKLLVTDAGVSLYVHFTD